MRARDLNRLAEGVHDLLIVGGGIYGLAIAADAASRGLGVALVDAADLGAATSFNQQKTAHGGLRSLQSGRIGHARESILERRALARIAPRLLRPLPFIVGTYRSVVKNRVALRIAFRVDRWLGRDRNEGVEPELHLPPPRLASRAATVKLFGGVRPDRLTGGAMWYDYQIVESERLTVAFAEAADGDGAHLANYAEALQPLRENGTIAGMRVKDRLTGADYEVRALLTINAAGAKAGEVMRAFGVNRPLPLLKAMNLVTSKPTSDIAMAAPAASGRMLTVVPWRGRAIVGTSQSADLKQPSDLPITAAEVDAFIREANEAFPALKLTREDITLVHRGIVPATPGAGGAPGLLPGPRILDHASDGAPGAMTVLGVKYTTARGVAARVTTQAAQRLRRRVPPSRTDKRVLPGAGIADHEALAIETARAVGLELSPTTIRHLTATYGDRCEKIIRLMVGRSDWRTPLVPGLPHTGAEVIYTVRQEMACTLADVVIRRMGMGSGGHPGAPAVMAAGRVAADELGWDAAQLHAEVEAVDDFYRLPF